MKIDHFALVECLMSIQYSGEDRILQRILRVILKVRNVSFLWFLRCFGSSGFRSVMPNEFLNSWPSSFRKAKEVRMESLFTGFRRNFMHFWLGKIVELFFTDSFFFLVIKTWIGILFLT